MPRLWILLPFLLLLFGGFLFSLTKERVYKLDLADAPALEEVGEPIVNSNFYGQAKERLIAEKTDFIEADLSAMKLTLYEGGEPRESFPILTKGREGSWWETPAGIYRVGNKAQNHFSSFGQVYQPWSIQFQGNFFIHGWPYYPGGQPVTSTYSGGCIRLASADAERVFEKAKIGMPVLVFEESFFNRDGFSYPSAHSTSAQGGEQSRTTSRGKASSGQLAKGLNLRAESYLAADLKNNYLFTRKESDKVLPVGSVAALMTALVATDHANIEKRIENHSIYDLLFPMLLTSSDEAATTIAEVLGEERFAKLMNQKAQSIGMNNTSFAGASGRESTSTAQNLFDLAKYLFNNRSFILRMTAGHLDTAIYGKPAFSDLENLNVFGDDSRFIGGKLGKDSNRKEAMVAVFEIDVRGEKRPIAIVVLGSDGAGKDIEAILDYIEINYGS